MKCQNSRHIVTNFLTYPTRFPVNTNEKVQVTDKDQAPLENN
jgi:hypothetical protein